MTHPQDHRCLVTQTIVIFGSVARHEADDDSDIDMLAVMETDRPWHNRPYPIRCCLERSMVRRNIIALLPRNSKEG
ncbi:MAG: nucleotidyltransferase domain-containing protein [Candidatus Methanomethylophilaceae archaeon]